MEPTLASLLLQDAEERAYERPLVPLESPLPSTSSLPAGLKFFVRPLAGISGVSAAVSGLLMKSVIGNLIAGEVPKAMLGEAALPSSGSNLLDACGLTARALSSLVKMENALDEEDSYADITLGVLRQVERLLRGIFLVEDRLPEELVEAVSARLDEPTRKYLEHVASEGQPLTLGAVEVWLRGLDRAWAATDPLVTDQLRSLLRDPGRVFGKSRLPRGVQRWRPLRNRLAHGDHALPVSEHRRVCTSVLARAGVDEFVKKAVLPSQSVIVGLMIERSLMIRPA